MSDQRMMLEGIAAITRRLDVLMVAVPDTIAIESRLAVVERRQRRVIALVAATSLGSGIIGGVVGYWLKVIAG